MLPSLTHSSLVSRSYGIPRWASTTSPANPPIAIIGAGPAGLMLARILSLNRIPYTVFERDASPVTRQGSGTLDVHPSSGQLTLKKAGLLDQFNASARHGVNTTIVDDQASVLLRLGGNEDKEERPEIDRKDLQRILQASVPNENIPWGSKIQQVTKSPEGGVSIHLPNENLESGFRLVVGADGARSRVRSLFTDVHPKYTGVTIFTTYIQPSDPIYASAADLAGQGNYLAMSGTQKLFLYYLGDKSYFLSVGTALPEAEAADKSVLKDASSLWDSSRTTIQGLVTRPHQPNKAQPRRLPRMATVQPASLRSLLEPCPWSDIAWICRKTHGSDW